MPNSQAKQGLFQFYPHNLLWLGLSVLAIVLDQWTKWIASSHLNYADPVPVLPFLNWTLLHNYGAAFSFYLMQADGNATSSPHLRQLFRSFLYFGSCVCLRK